MSQQERDLGFNNGVAVKASAVPHHCEERRDEAIQLSRPPGRCRQTGQHCIAALRGGGARSIAFPSMNA
jgi:hypothetical protein